MLYNASWNSNVYTVSNLVAWLEQQPADKTYSYCDPHNCLMAQYLRAHGIEAPGLAPRFDDFTTAYRISYGGKNIDTFGAALMRARRLGL